MKTIMNVEDLMNEITIIDFEKKPLEQLTIQKKSSEIKIGNMDVATLAMVISPEKYAVISTMPENPKTKDPKANNPHYEIEVANNSEIGEYMDAFLQLPNLKDISHVHIYPYNLFKKRRTK